jgi:hypothetical protein
MSQPSQSTLLTGPSEYPRICAHCNVSFSNCLKYARHRLETRHALKKHALGDGYSSDEERAFMPLLTYDDSTDWIKTAEDYRTARLSRLAEATLKNIVN